METSNTYRWVRTASIDNGDEYSQVVESATITQAETLEDLQPPSSFEFGAPIVTIDGGILAWESDLFYEYGLLDPNDDVVQDVWVRNHPSLDDDTIVVAVGTIVHVKSFDFNTPLYVVGAWKSDLQKRKFSREKAEEYALAPHGAAADNEVAIAIKKYLKL